jgi:large subunit ribosomal protein L13
VLSGEHPERVMLKAIERMMPKDSPLSRQQFKHLHVYNGAEHPHAAQSPKVVAFAAMNEKNAR